MKETTPWVIMGFLLVTQGRILSWVILGSTVPYRDLLQAT